MRWQGRRQSTNVQYEQGGRGFGGRGFGGRGFGGRPMALGGGGIIVLLLGMGIFWCMGGNPLSFLSQMGSGSGITATDQGAEDLQGSPEGEFVAVVLATTEDVWHALFTEQGKTYREPQLMIFRGEVESACGLASSAIGPFYCPSDETIYLDLEFFEQLRSSLGAPGDFAIAYVIAHEVGHHVQNLLGTMERVNRERANMSESDQNALSVRLELQADFYAGVWAHHAQKMERILEPGDLEEAIRAAGAVGDDRLQRRGQGHVVPDSFTHGTSEQRIRWFRLGYDTGDLSRDNTWEADDL